MISYIYATLCIVKKLLQFCFNVENKSNVKKLEQGMPTVCSNNEVNFQRKKSRFSDGFTNKISFKKDLDWVRGVFSCENGNIYLYVKSPQFFHGFPIWVIRSCRVYFFLSPRI